MMNMTSVPQCTKLQMPDSLFIASYGGGDEMRLAQRFYAAKIRSDTFARDLPDVLPFGWANWKPMLWNDVKRNWMRYSSQDPNEAIVVLPKSIPDSLDKFRVSIDFLGCGFIASRETYNAMFQGWLFEEHLQANKEALGASKWPLIGVYCGRGIKVNQDQDPAWIGIESLTPADQHVHIDGEPIEVDGFVIEPEWQFGSDMAKFTLSEAKENEQHCGWIACVDLESNRIKLVYTALMAHKDQSILDPYIQAFKLLYNKPYVNK